MAHGETVTTPKADLRIVVHAGHAALAELDLERNGFNHGRMFDVPVDPSAPIVFSVEGNMSAPLTDDELGALRARSSGMNNEEAGLHIHKSTSSVKTYLNNASRKLNAKTTPEAVAKGIVLGLLEPRSGGAPLVQPLSDRMLQVVVMATLGFGNEEMCSKFPDGGLGLSTVKTHLEHAMVRLGVEKREEMITRFFELGLSAVQAPEVVVIPEQTDSALALVDVAPGEDNIA